MIIRWPGKTDKRAGSQDERLIYSVDAAASILELAGMEVPNSWDGQSVAACLEDKDAPVGRDEVVLSQLAWCAQRGARWDQYICIETYHDGYHDYPQYMVFDLSEDPHEQRNFLAEKQPELVAKGKRILEKLETEAARRSSASGRSFRDSHV